MRPCDRKRVGKYDGAAEIGDSKSPLFVRVIGVLISAVRSGILAAKMASTKPASSAGLSGLAFSPPSLPEILPAGLLPPVGSGNCDRTLLSHVVSPYRRCGESRLRGGTPARAGKRVLALAHPEPRELHVAGQNRVLRIFASNGSYGIRDRRKVLMPAHKQPASNVQREIAQELHYLGLPHGVKEIKPHNGTFRSMEVLKAPQKRVDTILAESRRSVLCVRGFG